jgi:hypothetical protein
MKPKTETAEEMVVKAFLKLAGLLEPSVAEDIKTRGIPQFIRYGNVRDDN